MKRGSIIAMIVGVAIAIAGTVGAETIHGLPTSFPTIRTSNLSIVDPTSTNPAPARFIFYTPVPLETKLALVPEGASFPPHVEISAQPANSYLSLNDATGSIDIASGTYVGIESVEALHKLALIGSNGGVLLGSITSTGITGSYRGTVTTDVAAVAANACNADIAITVTGAVTGAECIVGMPATTPALLQGTCFVSATNTVQLRICNGTNAASADPANATYSARVFNP